jgi:hypothetical protein
MLPVPAQNRDLKHLERAKQNGSAVAIEIFLAQYLRIWFFVRNLRSFFQRK